ncbi:MAG: ubiquinone biosynthesis regulatory protein kinase UbiB [Steroidobacteraceae bacterium]
MNLRVFSRLLQIHRVLVKHGLDEFVQDTRFAGPLRIAYLASPAAWFQIKHKGTRGERLRLALEELGPIFMKFGQALSTRRDLLPPDIADELAKLQDRVPPFPAQLARALIEQALEKPVTEVFAQFDAEPLAAATIAQVHAAQLQDGSEVVVKVVRPGIRALIERDIEVLYALAALAMKYWSLGTKLKPVEVVREYEKTIIDELDLMREAANASQLRHNFQNSQLLYAPKVYFDLCRSNVMVMERVRGVQISNMTELRQRGVNIQRLAENGVEIFFTQVFRHNFFHADMHPGNIFVLTEDPEHPVYAAIDFGIVGTLDPRDQHYLAENFLAFFNHDFRRVAQLHIDSGWLPAGTRVDEVESAVRTVCEPIFNKPLREISFGQVLTRLFEAAQRFDMEIQPQLFLLQKTLLQVEGLGRQLYPDLDLWKTAKPIMQEWMHRRMSPRGVLREWKKQLPDIGEAIRTVPTLIQQALMRASEGRYRVNVKNDGVEELRLELLRSARRRDQTILASALLFSGVLWFAIVIEPIWPGAICLLGGILTLLGRK